MKNPLSIIMCFCLTLREEVGVRLAGRLRGRQPLQRRGVVRGRVGYGDLCTENGNLQWGFVNPQQTELRSSSNFAVSSSANGLMNSLLTVQGGWSIWSSTTFC